MGRRRYVRSIRLPSWSKRFLGLEPMPVPPVVFAVDESRLRYARFERNAMGLELAEEADFDLDPDLFATGPLGGPMHDAERFRAAVAAIQAEVSENIEEASLVLPDPWLRMALVEDDDLPRKGQAREDVLRWKLQRVVPFRVEELRIRGGATASGPGDEQNRRILLGFGLESLLRQLEGVFQSRGIHIGYVSSESLSLLSAVQDLWRDVRLGAVAFVSARGYSLTFVLRGQPVLHRFKALPQLAGDEPPEHLVDRDLKLTQIYLREQFSAAEVDRLLLVSPPAIEERWLAWLSAGFGRQALPVRIENLPLSTAGLEYPLFELATLLGAARQEIA